MVGKETVKHFLSGFKGKMNFWDVYFLDDRGKNLQTLAFLEIRPIDRKKILEKLEVIDYCQGPIKEKAYGGQDMWVFGTEIKKKEIYIKINMGWEGSKVLCISFHIAEHKMKYPFKMNKS
jgi:hypothetical protein